VSFSVVPDAYTLAHYATVFEDSPRMIGNTLLYWRARGADRRHLRDRDRLPHPAHKAPGAARARFSGERRARHSGNRARDRLPANVQGIELPFTGDLITSSWIILVIAYTVRRLPYALRSCMLRCNSFTFR